MNAVSLVVRGDGDVTRLTPAITSVLAEIDPELPIRNIRTMDEVVATTLSQQRYSMWLFAALAGLAFLLASVGIYSVLAYSVRSRVTEISIRIALGASPADVLTPGHRRRHEAHADRRRCWALSALMRSAGCYRS